ncbi:unnamed protein product [Orchesella dallaii]|uniref:Uncharacterized protein n=1 Tax=Orchesella dallaii TaxID=48710 RepID=A0ABP1RUK0_9HEXA
MATSAAVNKKKWARIVGHVMFLIYMVVLCTAVNSLMGSLTLARIAHKETKARDALNTNATATLTKPNSFPDTDKPCDHQLTAMILAMLITFAVIRVSLSGLQLYSASLLIDATSMNVKPTKALRLVFTHENIQHVFLFSEVVTIMVATYSPGFSKVDAIFGLGSINLLISALFRIGCLYVVDGFKGEVELEAAAEKKNQVDMKATVLVIPPFNHPKGEKEQSPV